MARRKTKKEKKKQLKEDPFRQTMLGVAAQLKEYRYVILLAVTVVVLLFVLLSFRARRRGEKLYQAAELLKQGAVVEAEKLRQVARQVAGEPIEPWVLFHYGARLFKDYQEEGALKGDKTRLKEAKQVFEKIRARFPENGSVAFAANKALEVIEKELTCSLPKAVMEMHKLMTAPRPTHTLPRKGTGEPVGPKKPAVGKSAPKPALAPTPPEEKKQEPAPPQKSAEAATKADARPQEKGGEGPLTPPGVRGKKSPAQPEKRDSTSRETGPPKPGAQDK